MRSGHRRGKSVILKMKQLILAHFINQLIFSLRIQWANLLSVCWDLWNAKDLFVRAGYCFLRTFHTSADLLKNTWIWSAAWESRTGSGVRASPLSGMLGGAYSGTGYHHYSLISYSFYHFSFFLYSPITFLFVVNSSWPTIFIPSLSFPLPYYLFFGCFSSSLIFIFGFPLFYAVEYIVQHIYLKLFFCFLWLLFIKFLLLTESATLA